MQVYQNPSGRAQKFVSNEVHVPTESVEFDEGKLDCAARKRLARETGGKPYQAVKGVAVISWKSEESRRLCVEDHQGSKRRRRRWEEIQDYARRMKSGEYPDFGHVYVHPSLTGKDNLAVIDGTRRMVAYLEAGKREMPVVVLVALNAVF